MHTCGSAHDIGPIRRIIAVPVGTCVSRSRQSSQHDADESLFSTSGDPSGHGARTALPCDGAVQHQAVADLDAAAARILVAQGGLGGRGSISTYRADDIARCVSHLVIPHSAEIYHANFVVQAAGRV